MTIKQDLLSSQFMHPCEMNMSDSGQHSQFVWFLLKASIMIKIAVNSCDWGCFYNPCHVWQHSFNIPSSDIFFCWKMEEEVKAILHFQLGWTWMMAASKTVNQWIQIFPKLWQRLRWKMIKYVERSYRAQTLRTSHFCKVLVRLQSW